MSRGHIVNFSSVVGLLGRAGMVFYNATKFVVEGLSEALAKEVEPLGIRVIIVEPGSFRTEFLGRSINAVAAEMLVYAGSAGKARARIATPVKAGKAVIPSRRSRWC